MERCRITASALLSFIVVSGCADEVPKEETPPLQPVSGKVLLDGEPAAGIAVSFVPVKSGNGAYGSTDSAGQYSLEYRTGNPGVPAGEYFVIFSKMVQPDGSPIPEGKTAADVNAIDAIPEKYRDTTDRPLNQVTIPDGGGTFNFEVSSE